MVDLFGKKNRLGELREEERKQKGLFYMYDAVLCDPEQQQRPGVEGPVEMAGTLQNTQSVKAETLEVGKSAGEYPSVEVLKAGTLEFGKNAGDYLEQ